MFHRRYNVTAVDISSSKIRACLAELDKNKNVNVLAAEESELSTVKKAIVTDLAQTSNVLKAILTKLNKETAIDNRSLYVNVSGQHLQMTRSHGAVMIENLRGQINKNDIENVKLSAYAHSISLERQPVHNLVSGYIIDEKDRVLNPINMYARKLEVNLSIIAGLSNKLKNITKVINQAGYEVKEFIASALADSYSVLSEEERKSGVILIDIGAGVTDISLFKDDYLEGFEIIPVGGEEITSLISRELKVSLAYAEEIKKRYGNALDYDGDLKKEIILKDAGNNFKNITKMQICKLVDKSLRRIFSEIKSSLERMKYLDKATCEMVITGGSSLLDGLIERAQQTFNMAVRIGLPVKVVSSLRKLNSPTWSTCLGLAEYALKKKATSLHKHTRINPLSFMARKIESILTDYF